MSLKDQIQLAEIKLADAIASQNGQIVAELYTDDARFLPDGAPTLKGRTEIASFFEDIFRKGIVAGKFTTLEVDGDEQAATEIGAYQLFAQSPQGQRITAVAGRYLVTWKRIDGAWQLHRDVVSRDKSDD
ncbi:YybH family protein [Pseudomonas sp. DSP3-2-2]|uniref:YybH family protein n=1 Tax=unclassified Pseudomonas TaxID=196821 RepID=UPI003CF863B0